MNNAEDRIILKTAHNKIVSVPRDAVTKTLGTNKLHINCDDDETYWEIHEDYVRLVDEALFPAEYLI